MKNVSRFCRGASARLYCQNAVSEFNDLCADCEELEHGDGVRLTYAEACVVVESLRDVIEVGLQSRKEHLTQNVRAAINRDFLDSRHGADRVLVMRKLHALDEDACGALLDAVQSFWESGGVDLLNPLEAADVQREFEREGILA